MSSVAMLDGEDLNGGSRCCEETANQDCIVILWRVRKHAGSSGMRTEHTQPRARLPYLAHNLEMVVSIVRDVKTHVRVRRTPPRDSSGGSGLGGTTVDMKSSRDILLDHYKYEDQG
jgi:hypothetical protein